MILIASLLSRQRNFFQSRSNETVTFFSKLARSKFKIFRCRLELVPDQEGTYSCCKTPCIIISPLSAAFEPHGSDIGCSRIDLYARRCTRPRPRLVSDGHLALHLKMQSNGAFFRLKERETTIDGVVRAREHAHVLRIALHHTARRIAKPIARTPRRNSRSISASAYYYINMRQLSKISCNNAMRIALQKILKLKFFMEVSEQLRKYLMQNIYLKSLYFVLLSFSWYISGRFRSLTEIFCPELRSPKIFPRRNISPSTKCLR